jgi:hypothetical protein
MWICLNNAFMSAVINDRDLSKTTLKVRARKREHLAEHFPEFDIIETPDADYRFRVIVTKKFLAEKVKEAALNIDYSNFKDSVKDRDLHDLYADFWQLHYDYQRQQLRKADALKKLPKVRGKA